jgi:hypothetical protein
VGSPSGWRLVSGCKPAPSRLVSVWRTWRGHCRGSEPAGTDSMPCSGRRSLSLPRASRQGAGRGLADGRRFRGYVAVRAGAVGGVLAGWTICAPQEHESQTYPLSLPPSRSPQRWCSATKATKALSTSGMGPGHYHKMETKPIAREPARQAGAGTIWPLGRHYSATLPVSPARYVFGGPGESEYGRPITAYPLLLGPTRNQTDSFGGDHIAKGRDRYCAGGFLPRRCVGLPAAAGFRTGTAREQSRELRDS